MPAQKVRSKDNYQQNLRDNKRKWNFSYKDFSQKLKAFKDGINGRGNAKAGLPPTNIKEPLPAEVGSFLSQLAGDFQTIVGSAERIIAEQAQYARNRRKSKPKAPTPALIPSSPEQPKEQDKVVDTLSRLGEENYSIQKEASNKLTRFFQYISAIFSGKDFNKQRVGLLRQSADLYYSVLDLENDVLSLSISKIPNTISKYKQFKYNFDSFIGTFKGVEEMVERKAKQNGVNKPDGYSDKSIPNHTTIQPNVSSENKQEIINDQRYVLHPDLDKIKNTVHLLFNANLAKKYVVGLFDLFTKYDEEEDPDTKSMFADQIKEVYKNLPRFIAEEVQKKYGPSSKINSMNDIIAIIKNNKTAESISDYMIKTSHNFISRYLKKKLVKSIPFNKTAPVRLEISTAIDDIKNIIKKIMDNLEKQLSVQELNILIEKLQEDVDLMKRPLHVLNVFYMKQFFSNKEKQKKQKGKSAPNEQELMDYVLQRKLKRELSEDLF